MLVNGSPAQLISIRDRGLLYGDGVFRTFPARQGRVAHWHWHLKKLQQDCAALGIQCPTSEILQVELQLLLAQHPDGVYKLLVTRGEGKRGYTPLPQTHTSHFWDVTALPSYPEIYLQDGIAACFCDLRLATQPRLAGIKHLNRLENVLAAAELGDCPEGLLLDAHGHVIEGTRSNLFWLKDGQLHTPDLSGCGVAGVQRARILAAFPVKVVSVDVPTLLAADEIFMVNSLMPLWPIRHLAGQEWHEFPVAQRVREFLQQEEDACSVL